MPEHNNAVNRKYELTDDTVITSDGRTLHRIRAIRNFGRASKRVKAGQLGGFVESENNLSHDETAWISDDAEVSGHARVSGDAKVSGNAQVYGDTKVYCHAQVYDNAQVYGNAWVFNNAKVSENAQVYGDAWVHGDARVFGNARVFETADTFDNAKVFGNAQVFGDALVFETAEVFDSAEVSGYARVFGKAKVSGNDQVKDDTLMDGRGEETEQVLRVSASDRRAPRKAKPLPGRGLDDSQETRSATEVAEEQPDVDVSAPRHAETPEQPAEAQEEPPLTLIDNLVVETFPPHRDGIRKR